MNFRSLKRFFPVATLLAAVFVVSCSKDELPETPKEPKEPPTSERTVVELDWNNHSDGSYSEAKAKSDFGNLTSWNSRISIDEKNLVVKLLANELTGKGGIVTDTRIPKGSEYRLTYDVLFPEDFEWGKGGKVGFGLRIGDGNTGCDRADDGNGGSIRMMWYTSSSGRTRFKPYMYYKDMPDNCGDNLVSSSGYPASGNLEKNHWYTIDIYVKTNTGSNKDGHITYKVDNTVILDEAIRWTTNDSKSLIDKLSFATFRGGSNSDWMVDKDTEIRFDNLKLEKLK